MRLVVGCVLILIALPALAASDVGPDTPHADNPRFSAIPIPGDPRGIWLIDTYTGALAHCEFQSAEKQPQCTPWALAPGDSPFYRWDAETKKLIPMNEAAKRKEAEQPNSK